MPREERELHNNGLSEDTSTVLRDGGIEHIIYDKTREIRERDEEDRKRSEEHFERVLLKPDSFEWHKLYYNNCIPKDENTDHEQKL